MGDLIGNLVAAPIGSIIREHTGFKRLAHESAKGWVRKGSRHDRTVVGAGDDLFPRRPGVVPSRADPRPTGTLEQLAGTDPNARKQIAGIMDAVAAAESTIDQLIALSKMSDFIVVPESRS